MSILESISSKSFLGSEFLTWLLWRSETRNALIGVGNLQVHFGGSLALAAPFGDAEEVTLKGENPAAAAELGAALREGKMVARAQMRWVVDGVEWHVGVTGETLALAGLKPPLKSAPPDAEWIERRLGLLEEFGAAFDRAYEAFLAVRLSEAAWKRELAAMRAWVAAGPGGGEPAPLPEVIEIRDEEN